MLNPFYAYYLARKLESLSDDDRFIPVFASSDINVYPFQIAAANFALRSPYQKGVILCDEAGMGKSHEAMLVITQKWYEGKNRILIAIPNADLLSQWVELIAEKYTVPFVVLTNREDWQNNISEDSPNAFEQDAIILTTYDFLADQQSAAKAIAWDITVFEEANALISVHEEESGVKAKILKEIADNSFKILLTGTPIEKNIMDLYGLMYFIDETILPDFDTYMKRYLRMPENYPELAERISKYCFRTLRSQAKQYAKIPDRIHITYEYNLSPKEQELYNLLFAYCQKPNKLAFPDLSEYDTALKLLGYYGSSTAAVLQTVKYEIKKLQGVDGAETEISEFQKMQELAESITLDNKAKELISALKKIFPILKKLGANKKAVIFTESAETQKYLYDLLKDKYKTLLYNGRSKFNFETIRQFKKDGEVLISTDNGAKGFNFEEASLIVNYDVIYNTLKIEQRTCRLHRLNQQNDVITLTFINKKNYADTRKLELVGKRHILADGVFGVSDAVMGDFTDDLDLALKELETRARTKAKIESDYQAILDTNEEQNKQLVASAEDILFTTFTKELADKVKITPQYVEEKSKEINTELWELVKFFFEQYNANHDDCYYEIDDIEQSVTATNYEKLPFLFYYWSNGGSRKYNSQKKYGMAPDFKPHYGRITLSSLFFKGLVYDISCTNEDKLMCENLNEKCEIALYDVVINPIKRHIPLLVGKTQSGDILSDSECRNILSLQVSDYTQTERETPHWLKSRSSSHTLDRLVDTSDLLEKEKEQFTPVQTEAIDKIKLKSANSKSDFQHEISNLERKIKLMEQDKTATDDRMKKLTLTKQITVLQKDFMQKQEKQFFKEMQIDVAVKKEIEDFLSKERLTVNVVRQFVVEMEGKQNG